MENLGLCPSCEKGNIKAFDKGFGCDNFNAEHDKCSFFVYKVMYGKEITEPILQQIIANKETEVFSDLKNKDESFFTAKLVVENDGLKLAFSSEYLTAPCPFCGDKVVVTSKGYVCESKFKKECDFSLPKTILQRILSKNEAEILADGRKTSILDGFVRGEGKLFSAALYLDESRALKFDSSIGQCPKCKKGTLLANSKAYSCSNFKGEGEKCDFVIWREVKGKEIPIESVLELLEKGETSEISGFKLKGGEVGSGKLIIEDYKVLFVS